eukprot:CAMPEP_0170563250 /NCGR_PEP_ID=MMETSP0211-20121228/65338_1 /TAXON_ID=311385 /ORGANISM="Pseudokeronopsis sp., Strain OXSARD2" /LENGTH=130 /DNA_ID=CAMNT_0010881249 /DNA_START=379 /DNA_END=767 /DNA_ORIENTATION=-
MQSQQKQRQSSNKGPKELDTSGLQNLGIKPQYSVNDPRLKNVSEEDQQKLLLDLRSQWQIWSIPHFHRNKFMKSIQELPNSIRMGIVSQEIQELQKENSNVQLLMRAINARESCLREIVSYSENTLKTQL